MYQKQTFCHVCAILMLASYEVECYGLCCVTERSGLIMNVNLCCYGFVYKIPLCATVSFHLLLSLLILESILPFFFPHILFF